ncbi:hypothetical protein Q6796_000391 [Campylobacter coli]|nr:hypothetical protein [Campylobacter coli]
MTAYVHIGTPKTGTTTIQWFLSSNTEALERQNYRFLLNTRSKGQHRFIMHMINELVINHKIVSMENINKMNFIVDFDRIYNEVQLYKHCKIIFSSEAAVWNFDSIDKIQGLKDFLKLLGFSKIYIIIYIRDIVSYLISRSIQDIKGKREFISCECFPSKHPKKHIFDYKWILENYLAIFGKENLIVRIFSKKDFYRNNLICDFMNILKIEDNGSFIFPKDFNRKVNLLGVEILKSVNKFFISPLDQQRKEIVSLVEEQFAPCNNLNFFPSLKSVKNYLLYFKESNNWVRDNFFPSKEKLFSDNNTDNYQENYKLQEMKVEYWDAIADFIVNIVKSKNHTIEQKNNKIIELSKIQAKLKTTIEQKNNKIIELSKIQAKLKTTIEQKNNEITIFVFKAKHLTAIQRIQNQLSYRLGQVMIANSKSFRDFLVLPIVLLSIIISFKQEQKIYQEKIKKNPDFKLPPLRKYPDYQEAVKLKNYFSYKLGQAFIKASKSWYKGGYIKFLFEIKKLKKNSI